MRTVLSSKRKDIVKRYIRIRHNNKSLKASDVEEFVENYLCRDGLFLIRMLSLNAGEIVTSEIVAKLYEEYQDRINATPPPEKEAEMVWRLVWVSPCVCCPRYT